MTETFTEQGGAATMDPSALRRWMTSMLVRQVCSPRRLQRQRQRFERDRAKCGAPHCIEYFHQVDDAYSHLCAQLLQQLCARYDVVLQCHLVSGPDGDNLAEPDLMPRLARYDAHRVAAAYGLQFPDHPGAPEQALVAQATAVLAAQDDTGFVEIAAAVGEALWAGDGPQMQRLVDRYGAANNTAAAQCLARGVARRRALKHYSGAMFYYAGEWYWGVDRLYHLEQRLAELGVDRSPGAEGLAPRPPIEIGPHRDDGSLTLEFYPSLRSPYSAIAFDRTVDMARQVGVKLVVRPVLPMVMRGVPATREKGLYIFADTLREAAAAGVDYGQFYDPIGDPVRRCYALYPWACRQGKGNALLSSFFRAAFTLGINTNREAGLRRVVEQAGLVWLEAKPHLADPAWTDLLEDNRRSMYRQGIWGVPAYRLVDADGESVLALWGQDRLWLVSRIIQQLLSRRS